MFVHSVLKDTFYKIINVDWFLRQTRFKIVVYIQAPFNALNARLITCYIKKSAL